MPLYCVELKSWNFCGLVCLVPYMSLIAVKILMMLVMSALPFLVTTACPGLNPRLHVSCCPMSKEKKGHCILIDSFLKCFTSYDSTEVRIATACFKKL